MEVTTTSTKDTKKLAEQLAKKIKLGDTIALYGDLGSGKTTFVRFLVEALGIKSRVQSPTFVLVREYKGEKITVNHLDLYRLHSLEEAQDIGLTDILSTPNSLTVIEWPGIIDTILPKNTIKIAFKETGEESRQISIHGL